MSRTADVSALQEAGKQLLTLVTPYLEPDYQEALQMDMEALQILLVELEARQLAHEQAQWVLWHLLEGVMQEIGEIGEGVPEAKLDDFYNTFDLYVEAFEGAVTGRAKIVCPRLEALLGDHWIEVEEAEKREAGDAPEAGGEPEPEDDDGDGDDPNPEP